MTKSTKSKKSKSQDNTEILAQLQQITDPTPPPIATVPIPITETILKNEAEIKTSYEKQERRLSVRLPATFEAILQSCKMLALTNRRKIPDDSTILRAGLLVLKEKMESVHPSLIIKLLDGADEELEKNKHTQF